VEPLDVVALPGVLVEHPAQAIVTEESALPDALPFDGANPALGKGIGAGTPGRDGHCLDAGTFQGAFPTSAEVSAAIVDGRCGLLRSLASGTMLSPSTTWVPPSDRHAPILTTTPMTASLSPTR
jgi:hypothetical protein